MKLSIDVARAVAAELDPFEEAVDVALARGGLLIATMAEGRIEARLAPSMGHAAFTATLATMQSLGQARDNVVAARRELARTRAKLGLREVSIGSVPGCPKETGHVVEPGKRSLASVA